MSKLPAGEKNQLLNFFERKKQFEKKFAALMRRVVEGRRTNSRRMTISEFKGSEELNMLLIALGKKDEEFKNKPKTKLHPISPTKPTEFEIQRLISQVTIELARKKK